MPLNRWADWLESSNRVAFDARFGVPFDTVPLAGARLLWLNARWFAANGFDLSDPEIAAEIEGWLLQHFGVIADDSPDPSSTLFAERYGGTHGIVHGGSGRAGSRDGFNAKGIGRTPLVGTRSDFHHVHGALWLYEAVREIIASEIADAELPRGAVPIIALLDTGQDLRFPDQLVRRAIIVRPDFVRPAIFERSVFFGTSGTFGSDQALDASRVRAAVKAAATGSHPFGTDLSIESIFEGIAVQLGAGRALRLWQGQFTSSNIAIDGAWADFGAFCAMPDWRCAERGFGARFGTDELLIYNTVRSICFYWAKCGALADARQEARRIVDRFPRWVSKSFDETLARELRLRRLLNDQQAGTLLTLLNRYYVYQQRQECVYEESPKGGWIVGDFERHDDLQQTGSSSDYRYSRDFAEGYGDGNLEGARTALARRTFAERPLLYPTAADRAFKRYANPSGEAFRHTPHRVQAYIDERIGQSRRAWPEIDERYLVLAQYCRGATTVLLTADLDRSGEYRWLIDGPVTDDRLRLSFADLPLKTFGRHEVGARRGLLARFDVPFDLITIDERCLVVDGQRYVLPGSFIKWTADTALRPGAD